MNDIIFKTILLKGETGVPQSVEKTATDALEDTYTMTFADGTTATFTVTNGSSIESIEKTGTAGLVDTYTVTYTNGSTSTFTVTNGASGTNANMATIESTITASRDYAVGDYVVMSDGLLYKVTTAVTSGSALIVNNNIERTYVGTELTALANSLQVETYTGTITVNASSTATVISGVSGTPLAISAVNLPDTNLYVSRSIINDSAKTFVLYIKNTSDEAISGTVTVRILTKS